MRRFSFTALASVLVLALAPAAALARHHKHHSRSHSHHSRAHTKRFGDVTPASSTSTTAPPSDAVGSVQSFANGVLTIALNDGSTVSGAVTNSTELECEAAENPSTTSSTGQDGDHGSSGSESSGGPSSSGGDTSGGDTSGGSDEGGDGASQCTTANLTPGTLVRGAELRISSAGSTWEKVELILQPAA